MIRCDQHDLIEIACLYRIPVRLLLKDRQIISGVPRDTGWTKAHQESLLIEKEQKIFEIVLDSIQTMTALHENRYFSEVRFEDMK